MALGPYRLLSELGSGGMGTVHAAEVAEAVAGLDARQKIAVKVLHPHLLITPGSFKRFVREKELARWALEALLLERGLVERSFLRRGQ